MFTAGVVGFAFTELHRLSKRAEAIYEQAKARVEAHKDSYRPGLLEQYEIQLERVKSGVGCELISFPKLLSGPSEFLLSSFLSLWLTHLSLEDPPEQGKKYYTIATAINHCFSRGTIVRFLCLDSHSTLMLVR